MRLANLNCYFYASLSSTKQIAPLRADNVFELDNDTKEDILDSLQELSADVELTLSTLSAKNNTEQLNQIFRAIHTIKGNAAMFQLSPLVDFTHALEELASALRSQAFPASPPICDCIQLGMDKLKDLHQRELRGEIYSQLYEIEIQEQYLKIAQTPADKVDSVAQAVIDRYGADTINKSEYSVDPEEQDTSLENNAPCTQAPPLSPATHQKIYSDLAFFQEISFQIDSQNPYWVARSIQLFDWALKMNQLANDPIDYQQLSAATYMHDIGMSFIPATIINKPDKLTESEFIEIHRHPVWGFEFLSRIEGWQEASTIILHHHERIDGKGYPAGITDTEIHPGAKIIAILDAFFSMINGRADRKDRRTTLRAISEINSKSGTQFDQFWVEHFNDMIKHEVKGGAL